MNEGLGQNPESEEKTREQAVVLIKPGYSDQSERLVGYLEKKGLTVVEQKNVSFDKETARAFYPHAEGAIDKIYGPDEGKEKMREFTDYISSGEAVAFLVEGEDAIQIVNRLRDKVRSWFKLEKPEDAVHASSDPEEAEREAGVLGLSHQ